MSLLILIVPNTALGFISLALISGGAYIDEQRCYGFDNNSLHLWFILSIIQMSFFYLGSNFIKIKNLNTQENFLKFFVLSCLMVVFILFVGSQNSNPTRFNFFNVSPEIQQFGTIISFLYQASIYYFVLTEVKTKNVVIYIIGAAVIFYLQKAQFSPFLLVLDYLFIRYFFGLDAQNLCFKEWLKKVLGFFFIFLVLLLLALTYKLYALGDLDSLINRIVLQNHMFWGAVNIAESPSFINVSLAKLTQAFFTLTPEFAANIDIGVGHLMSAISDYKLVITFIQDNTVFAGNLIATVVFYFGISYSLMIIPFLSILYVFIWKFKIFFIRVGFFIFIISFKMLAPLDQLYLTGEVIFLNVKFFYFLFLLFIFAELYFISKLKTGILK